MTRRPLKIAIFASGNGSNAEALVKWSISRKESVNICGVLTDNPQAGVIGRMATFGVNVVVVPRVQRLLHEAQILSVMADWQPDWIFLAGFMRVLSANFLAHFRDPEAGYYKVVNIHPSALPDFPGLDACRRSFDSSGGLGGVTVHLVDEGVDTGQILAQETFSRVPGEDFASFAARGQAIEHRLYVQVLQKIVQNKGVSV